MSNKGWFIYALVFIGTLLVCLAVYYGLVCVAWWAICWLLHMTFDFVTPLVIAILLEVLTILINLLRKSKN